jgi:hypothetical protein
VGPGVPLMLDVCGAGSAAMPDTVQAVIRKNNCSQSSLTLSPRNPSLAYLQGVTMSLQRSRLRCLQGVNAHIEDHCSSISSIIAIQAVASWRGLSTQHLCRTQQERVASMYMPQYILDMHHAHGSRWLVYCKALSYATPCMVCMHTALSGIQPASPPLPPPPPPPPTPTKHDQNLHPAPICCSSLALAS